MDIKHLKRALAIAKHKNFRRAAEELHLSQQALSTSIAELEQQLGTPIFERGRFGADMTPVGRALEGRFRLICAEMELLASEAKTLGRGAKGAARVGVTPLLTPRIVPLAMATYARTHTDVSVSVVQDSPEALFDRLLVGELDFCVAWGMIEVERFPDLEHRRIEFSSLRGGPHLIMSATHTLASAKEISWADARRYPWVLPESQNSVFGQRIFNIFKSEGLAPPECVLHTDSMECAKSMVLRTDYVAVAALEMIQPEVDAGMLRAQQLPGLPQQLPVYFSSRSTPLQPVAQALARTFENALKSLSDARVAS